MPSLAEWVTGEEWGLRQTEVLWSLIQPAVGKDQILEALVLCSEALKSSVYEFPRQSQSVGEVGLRLLFEGEC